VNNIRLKIKILHKYFSTQSKSFFKIRIEKQRNHNFLLLNEIANRKIRFVKEC